MKLSNMKMKTKLMAVLVPVIFVAFSLTILFVYSKTDTIVRAITFSDAENLAKQYGNQIKAELEEPLVTARSMASSMAEFSSIPIEKRREFYLQSLKKNLEDNPQFLGAWTVWESNALDGMDSEYSNTPGHDASGRFIPYWNYAGGLHLEACVTYDTEDSQSDYYNRPKKTKQELILEPFSYEVNGEMVQMVSAACPIIVNGEVVGVAGADLGINAISQRIGELKPYNSGYAALIASNGVYAAHPNPKMLGKMIDEEKQDVYKTAKEKILAGEQYDFEFYNEENSRDEKIFYIPIEIGRSGLKWYLAIACPIDEVLAENQALQQLLILIGIVVVAILIVAIFLLARFISKPLEIMQEAADKLSRGDMSADLSIEATDEIGQLASSFRNMKSAIESVINELGEITIATTNGRLDKRCNTTKFQGSYKEIVVGVNGTLDAVIQPLNMTAEYVDRIAKGDIPSKINEEYKGDFNEIKNNINQLIDTLNFFVNDMLNMYHQQKAGDIEVMMHPDNFLGVYREMANGVNNVAGIHLNNMLMILNILESYANGDMTPVLDQLPGKQAIANERMDMLRNNLLNIITELNKISDSAINGRLDVRGNADNFKGAYNEIVSGINGTLDAIINPLNVAAEYIDRISKGDIPDIITDEYKGDFNEMKENFNRLFATLNNFISDMKHMYEVHKAGDFEGVMAEEKYLGAFREMTSGVNNSVQMYVQLLAEILSIAEAYAQGNFNEQLRELPGKQIDATNRMNLLKENLLKVVSELDKLGLEVKTGNLDYSCDESKFQNGWKDLVVGLNNMKDSVAKPVNDMNDILKHISVNDYQVVFESGYEGVWLEQQNYTKDVIGRLNHILKITRNVSNGNLEDLEHLQNVGKRSANDELVPSFIRMIESIKRLVVDAEEVAKYAADGQLHKRADESKHSGEFANVIGGFNKTIDNLVAPLRIAASFADAISKGDQFEALTDDYRGEYKAMADNINTCIEVLNRFSQDIYDQTEASINGQLGVRTDISRYTGAWRGMVEGMNNIMDAMSKPLNEAGKVLEVLAAGDLRSRMQGNYEGEFDKLSMNINRLGDSLQDLIRNVIEVVNAVSEASNEINSNSNTVATASQEQSSQAEEIATAIEQMARTVTENADNAGKTSVEAKNNGQIAKEGGSIVSQTVTKMQDIATVVRQSAENIQKLGESSKQIGQIISVIDEIADQTNLLALNAAIEAARAGEQGRGFAVVADEVRKLAERTTEATKQIATMIKGVQEETEGAVGIMKKGNDEVKQGIDLADQAGKSLSNIVGSTNHVIEMIMQIAAASEEQSATTEQIAKNITAISSVSQETAEQISFIAEAATRMSEYTSQLNLVVNQFKIDEEEDFRALPGSGRKHLMPH